MEVPLLSFPFFRGDNLYFQEKITESILNKVTVKSCEVSGYPVFSFLLQGPIPSYCDRLLPL
jgi:hypothetical protein